ncbi:MAG: Holliday junction branch migration protein RuvA [Coxiellaceae bacterium]|jgi:Holliday junction DNA helicase RuvA|nr:Holliday junction branch migration protein RuvA [Coxiellaceae bacterium]
MIGFLRGILLEKEAPNLTIEVNGIGYEVQVALSNFINLPPLGQEVSLYIHLATREDGEFLYGFINKEQRSLFRTLIKISNIGPKIALAILSAMEPTLFAQHLVNNNVTALEKIPGIGAKTAKRLIVEMRDKIDEWESSSTVADSSISTTISALVALGYKPHEARQALSNLKDQNLPSEELIRLALKKIK